MPAGGLVTVGDDLGNGDPDGTSGPSWARWSRGRVKTTPATKENEMAQSADEVLAAMAEDARIARQNTERILELLDAGAPGAEPVSDRHDRTVLHPTPGTGPTGRGLGHRH